MRPHTESKIETSVHCNCRSQCGSERADRGDYAKGRIRCNTKKFIVGTLLVVLSCGNAMAEDAPDPSLTDKERAHLVKLLDASRDMLMGLITGLSDEQWTFKQNADRWSVAECTEHIVRTERALLDAAKLALRGDPAPEWHERTTGKVALLERIMPNRNPGGAGGASAPQEVRPSEHWSRAKAIRELYIVRGEVRALACPGSRGLTGPLRRLTKTAEAVQSGDLSRAPAFPAATRSGGWRPPSTL